MKKEIEIANYKTINMPTKYGDFIMYVWKGDRGREAVALVTPNLDVTKTVLLRIHSECLTGDNFGTLLCDCGEQKEVALYKISESNNGIFIYDRQEGRGIGLFDKIEALELQRKRNIDTYMANRILGYKEDERTYEVAIKILNFFNISNVDILTNNPEKINRLKEEGIFVDKHISISGHKNKYNQRYMDDKILIGKHLVEE